MGYLDFFNEASLTRFHDAIQTESSSSGADRALTLKIANVPRKKSEMKA